MKITEDWLRANGWEVHHYDHPALKDHFQYATKMFGKDKVIWNEKKELTIFRDYEEDSGVYADCLIDNVDTVEKLNDALILCGVRKKSEIFEKCLAKVDAEVRAKVRKNMDSLNWIAENEFLLAHHEENDRLTKAILRLMDYMEAHHLSESDIADIAGVSEKFVHKLVHGQLNVEIIKLMEK